MIIIYVRKNDIAILEGTYNCVEDELKKELVPYNIKIAPAEVLSLIHISWRSHRGSISLVTTNCEKSAEPIVVKLSLIHI